MRLHLALLVMAQLGVAALSGVAHATSASELKHLANRDVKDPVESLSLATRLRGAGLYKDAIRLMKVAVKRSQSPELTDKIQLEWARNEMQKSRMAVILEACKPLAKTNALLNHICLAEAQIAYHRSTLALPEAEAALVIDPNNYDAKLAHAKAQRMAGQTVEAQKALAALVAKEPNRVEAYPALAQLQLDTGGASEAIATLRKGLKVGPDNAELHLMLGSQIAPGEEAIKLLTAATELFQDYGDAYAALGEVHLKLQSHAEAEKMLKKALGFKPKNAPIVKSLGQIYFEKGDGKAAVKQARQALAWMPSYAAAKLLEAKALALAGEIDEAIEEFQKAYGIDRKNPTVLLDAARACMKAGRATTAMAFAERATVDFADWGPAWEVLGDVASAQNEIATAKKAYGEALKHKGLSDAAAVKQKLANLK